MMALFHTMNSQGKTFGVSDARPSMLGRGRGDEGGKNMTETVHAGGVKGVTYQRVDI